MPPRIAFAFDSNRKDAIISIPQDAAVETGEALRTHLLLKLAQLVEFAFRAELSGEKFARPRPHPVRDVVARNDDVSTPIILAAYHDVAVRMAGIEVVGGHPVELGAEIGLYLPHQVADKRFEVGEFGRILQRHDKAELVTVALAPLGERPAVGAIATGVIKLAGSAVARDTIALHVLQMRADRACIVSLATGVGVPSNVRKLYRFISWNWQPGDEIYMFGFSRGAFTIRTLGGLIHSQGLIPVQIDNEAVSHSEMSRNAMAAWRAYRSGTTSWKDTFFTITIVRLIRDAALALFHLLTWFLFGHRFYRTVARETARQHRQTIPITFLGLFDTVEAFGVPIEELRRAIDFAIWPISFRNRILCDNVEQARHALSLDDERETFHPVRFDRENAHGAMPAR